MNDIVSEKVLAKATGGKYSQWAAGLSTEYLELLFWVVTVYADECNKAKINAGINPKVSTIRASLRRGACARLSLREELVKRYENFTQYRGGAIPADH